MKVLLASPFYHQQRGNTVTVERISNGLSSIGIQTNIISTTEVGNRPDLPSFDICHGFHAYRFYKFMERYNLKIHPYIITMTGTDLNQDLFDESRRYDVIQALKGASAVHVFEDKGKQIVEEAVPEINGKVSVIPQGIGEFPKLCNPYQKEEGTFLFLLPAGIRKIKNIPFAICMLSKLRENYPQICLWLIGPILEEEEGNVVQMLVKEHESWIKYIGQIPHSKMGLIYEHGDVVLNCSHSEGQSTAVLEAMSYGIPPLVSDNNGNRSIVSDGKTGFVYNGEQQLLNLAELFVNDPTLRKQMGMASRNYVKENHSIEKEISTFNSIYHSILY